MAQVAVASAALPLRSVRRAPAETLLYALQRPRSSAAGAVSAARAQLKKEDFAIVTVENFRRMAHSETKQHLSEFGVDVRHVHNVSNIGNIGNVLELVVSKTHRDEIVQAITQVPEGFTADQCLRVNDTFDAPQPLRADANAEVKEKVLADFNARMRSLQTRATSLGWAGLSDFFAGRVHISAARRSGADIVPRALEMSTPGAPADSTMEEVPK
ncbi:hypothetical protein A4X13_0g8287 [Tilletia indica]|uniref:Uncharacterized protein n=1 Tax=Tilletia indica TaxID=43049 RepID=A0A177TKC1_9BASI|nr:hypothetical protein A4X13_0g8287 [Tilletia indica]